MKLGLVLGFIAEMAQAEIVVADYETVAAELGGVLDFESFETVPEPGLQIDGVILGPGLSIGERFEGQEVERAFEGRPFERLYPATPDSLMVLPGAPGENHAVAYHAGFGSNALFPLGLEGFAQIEGRGEGVTAIRFVEPQAGFGFRVHADYADPLGSRPAPGHLVIRVFDAEATLLAAFPVSLEHGVMSLAWRSTGAPVAGITIGSVDPGGIAIDDILFALEDLTG